MKKLSIILVLICLAFVGRAQVFQSMNQYGYGPIKRMWVDSTLMIPTICGTPSLKTYETKHSAIAYDSCNKRLYFYDPKLMAWDTIKSGSFDSTSLSARIDARVRYSDTAGMLTNYVRTSALAGKVDSVKKSTDSVYYWKAGQKYLAFRDSAGGGGQNGRFGNDTAIVVMAKVHNDAGVQLTNGKVVYLSSSGSSSDVPSVKLANNKGDSSSANTFGFVHGTIAVNDTGWVILSGKIEKLNTSGYSNGDIIYLDSVSGQWTKNKPKAPYHMVYLGVVVKANAGNGSIFVKCQNGYELDEIHDVQINSKVNNQILVYSDTQKVWKNRSVYSVVDTTSLSNRINGLNLQKITDVGNTTSNDIYAKSIYVYDDGNDDYVNLSGSNEGLLIKDIYDNLLLFSQNAQLSIVNNGSLFGAINNGYITTNRTYFLPDTSGTFALRGDSTLFQTKYRSDTARINTYAAISTKLNSADSTIYQTKYRTDTLRTNIYNALNGKEAALTFSTGLTRSSNTITSNLSTGVSGGQTAIGGTASGNSLTLSSTSNATKGKIIFGTSAYDEVNNRLGIGTTSPTNIFDVIRGTAGTMGRATYESGSFSYNGDMKVGVYTSSSNSAHGAAISFAQTNLQANSRYPGFDMQYVYSSTVASNAWRVNYTERSSTGTVQNYAANLLQVYANGVVSLNPAVSGVTSSAKLFVGHNTDAGYMLDINGTGRFSNSLTTTGLLSAFVSKSADYTLLATDEIVGVDASGAARAITLPTAASKTGQTYTIKKTDNSANAVTIGTTSSQTIDGAATYSLPTQWKYVTVTSNGSNWLIIANN